MPVTQQANNSDANQQGRDRVANRQERERPAEKGGKHHYAANGQRMPNRDWDKRSCYGAAFLLLHPQCHREEPPHAGVDSVVGTEEQHQPQGHRAHLGMHHFSSE